MSFPSSWAWSFSLVKRVAGVPMQLTPAPNVTSLMDFSGVLMARLVTWLTLLSDSFSKLKERAWLEGFSGLPVSTLKGKAPKLRDLPLDATAFLTEFRIAMVLRDMGLVPDIIFRGPFSDMGDKVGVKLDPGAEGRLWVGGTLALFWPAAAAAAGAGTASKSGVT